MPVHLRKVTFNEWADFSLEHGPVTFSEPDGDTMEGRRTIDGVSILIVRSEGYMGDSKSYFVNDAAPMGRKMRGKRI